MGGPVDDDMANLIVAQLLYLDSVSPSKDITMYVNSPGGSVTAGAWRTPHHTSMPHVAMPPTGGGLPWAVSHLGDQHAASCTQGEAQMSARWLLPLVNIVGRACRACVLPRCVKQNMLLREKDKSGLPSP